MQAAGYIQANVHVDVFSIYVFTHSTRDDGYCTDKMKVATPFVVNSTKCYRYIYIEIELKHYGLSCLKEIIRFLSTRLCVIFVIFPNDTMRIYQY